VSARRCEACREPSPGHEPYSFDCVQTQRDALWFLLRETRDALRRVISECRSGSSSLEAIAQVARDALRASEGDRHG